MILLDLEADAQHPNFDESSGLTRGLTGGSAQRPDRDPPAEVLAKVAVTAAIATKDVVDAELFGTVRVGLMLSSARPGVKKLMFVLIDRTNPKRKTECALITGTGQPGELTLIADCMGKTEEVARLSLKDPKAAEALHKAVEKFVLAMVEQFSQATR
jgi:hypothetical protein